MKVTLPANVRVLDAVLVLMAAAVASAHAWQSAIAVIFGNAVVALGYAAVALYADRYVEVNDKPSVGLILALVNAKLIVTAAILVVAVLVFKLNPVALIAGVTVFYLLLLGFWLKIGLSPKGE